jgi:diguanylate cyclase (GGDEF)-like protein
MAADLQHKLLTLCIDMDTVAFQVYGSFAKASTEPELRKLWLQLGKDEADHIGYWGSLIRQHEEGAVPEPFADPAALIRSLEQAAGTMHAHMSSAGREMDAQNMDSQKMLTTACLMELAFLQQPLLQALRYVRTDAAGEEPLVAYDRHLHAFLAGVGAHGTSPDLRLSVEALRRLWEETKSLIGRAFTDPLTGLLNRRGLYDTALPLANLAKRNGSTIGVAMADIDRFKSINDTRGHEAGDRVLASTAATIRSAVRTSDLVARVGGEEFVVFFSDVDASSLRDIGEKIRAGVEGHPVGGIAVTVSVGLACSAMARDNDAAAEIERLIGEADERMYRAKSEGRNRVVA